MSESTKQIVVIIAAVHTKDGIPVHEGAQQDFFVAVTLDENQRPVPKKQEVTCYTCGKKILLDLTKSYKTKLFPSSCFFGEDI